MPRILDFGGRDVERIATVASIKQQKGRTPPLAQVTAENAEEAAAAEEAGIEMIVCLDTFVEQVREGSTKLFVTAAIDFSGAVGEIEMLGTAYNALRAGADAVITARGFGTVRRLAEEDIPVMGHLGFVPKNSTWYGGVRAVGKTADEAIALWDKFRRLEDAGAFGVECELIPAPVMAEINKRTGLSTISLGSGPDADVMFLFMTDICGEGERVPRHARAYGNIAALKQRIAQERLNALKAYRADVAAQSFPSIEEVASIKDDQFEQFLASLEKSGG